MFRVVSEGRSLPQKVHEIGHKTKYFDIPDDHLSEPAAQRNPLLQQASSSNVGKRFAGRNAEWAFLTFLPRGTCETRQ